MSIVLWLLRNPVLPTIAHSLPMCPSSLSSAAIVRFLRDFGAVLLWMKYPLIALREPYKKTAAQAPIPQADKQESHSFMYTGCQGSLYTPCQASLQMALW